ncbi:hypothetical protein BGP_3811 [Beggiatoa sp. PS]|nr:hypothetical protein BGP_3811 [Beggiatoa sp. PS]
MKYYLRLHQQSTKKGMRPQLSAFLDKKGEAKHVSIKKNSMCFQSESGAKDWIEREAKDFKRVGAVWKWTDEDSLLAFSLEIVKA